MGAESAADRAAFFSTADFATAASYTPAGGQAQTVAVILDEPRRGINLGGLDLGVQAIPRRVRLRADQVALPAEGDAIVIGGVSYTVGEAPSSDPTGTMWTLNLRAA